MNMNINYEGILTTYEKQDKVRASPIGFQKKEEKILITLYENSKTLKNIRRNKHCTLNLVKDPEILAGTTYNLINLKTSKAPNIKAPKLKNYNFLELKLIQIEEEKVIDDVGTSKAYNITLKIINKEINTNNNYKPLSYSRGGPLLLEAAINLTRAQESAKKKGETEKFLNKTQGFINKAENLGVRRQQLVVKIKKLTEELKSEQEQK